MEVIFDLVAEVEESMRDIGFAESYIAFLGHTWNALDRWLAERGLAYEPSLGRSTSPAVRSAKGAGPTITCSSIAAARA